MINDFLLVKRKIMRMPGIEPESPPWKGGILTIVRHTLQLSLLSLNNLILKFNLSFFLFQIIFIFINNNK